MKVIDLLQVIDSNTTIFFKDAKNFENLGNGSRRYIIECFENYLDYKIEKISPIYFDRIAIWIKGE